MLKLQEINNNSQTKQHSKTTNKYYQFEDEENPAAQNEISSPVGKKRLSKRVIGQAKRIIVEPIKKSEFYRLTKIEFSNQSKGQRIQTYITCACSVYWIMNSALGFYIMYSYPQLQETHPNIFKYLLIFSGKWIMACFASILMIMATSFILKLCCCANGVIQNTVGFFPIVYLVIIFFSYMYSLYYGVVIIKEIYTPETPDEEATYHFYEARELLLLKAFVFNEIIVGAIIIVQLI